MELKLKDSGSSINLSSLISQHNPDELKANLWLYFSIARQSAVQFASSPIFELTYTFQK